MIKRAHSSDVITTCAHGHLLSGVGREVEDADAEQRDEHTRDDEVDGVEERLSADLERVRDLRPVVLLARIALVLQLSGTLHHVPRSARNIVAQVDLLFTLVPPENYLLVRTHIRRYQQRRQWCIYIPSRIGGELTHLAQCSQNSYNNSGIQCQAG